MMENTRKFIGPIFYVALMCSIGALWAKDTRESLLVMWLMTAPLLLVCATCVVIFPQVRSHPKFPADPKAAVADIMGGREKWFSVRVTIGICYAVSSIYMIMNSDLRPCGFAMLFATILNYWFVIYRRI